MKCLLPFLCFFSLSAIAQLPLDVHPGERIALIGNTLFDRMRDFGHFEALLQQRYAEQKITVRNLAWSADEVGLRPRPDGFGDINQHLTEVKADVILAAFGFNESFKGKEGLPDFKNVLKAFLIELKSHHYNGKSAPRIVLVSPTRAEKPHGHLNDQMQPYVDAMREVAAAEKVGFADVFAEHESRSALTINGIHLTDTGYALFANDLYQQLTQETPPPVNAVTKAAVEEKEKIWFQHYRPLNYYYIKGGRAEPYGVVNFPGELKKLSQMTENRDKAIHGEKVSDESTEKLPVITGDRPINEWHTPADELKAFKIDPRFEVNCFASEEDFPDLFRKPIAIRWDGKGRMWVSTSTTYPQILPGQAAEDQILILEDTNGDHKADKCSVWADKLHMPLSFEFGNGGVYVSDQPHLTFLKDTDGDGKADHREKILTGFGTEDSHHALHDFVWSPEGDLIFRESIFHHSQVETPYGPVRARESSFFRFTPATGKLLAFGSYMSTNPWGITFDDWGFHVGSHPVFASAVHALNAPYPDIHVPAGSYFPAYSGTCGQEFLSSSHWPDELRKKHFMRVRYKPTNEVELHEWIEKDTHFEEKKVGIVFQSTDLSFIPVDIQQGPDGAMYVADWYNPVKGHMQYSLRDTRRDKKSGRIWRITAKDRQLEEAPKIAGASVPELLELLKSENYRTRYRAKVELRSRSNEEVEDFATELFESIGFGPIGDEKKAKEVEQHRSESPWLPLALLESAKWLPEKGIDTEGVPGGLVSFVLRAKNHLARATVTRQLRWHYSDVIEGKTLLQTAANDPSGLVRLEAAIAASYIGTQEALIVVLDLLKHPMDEYLTYALRTSLDSHTLQPLWKGNEAFLKQHPELVKFIQDSEPKKPAQLAKRKKAEKPNPFDNQPNLVSITIKTIPERLLFDLREFKVKAGQPVKLVFENPDVTPHNLLIVQPGAADEIGMAGNEMAKTPDGFAKGFTPDSPKILHKTKMLNQGDSETLRFTAPAAPGRYPYICSFPGHWLVMKGEMVVE
ncbi:MAG: hypothetical protein JNJ83_18240 [Verrucomicrobiaceae bacterium]|nr:hypothetical protein [Verrucomicrobiaceae bacterium]